MSREKFLETYKAFMSPRLPAIEKEWDKLPDGFRRLLCVQSGQKSLIDTPIQEMTKEQLRKLAEANDSIARLCQLGGATIRRYVMAKF